MRRQPLTPVEIATAGILSGLAVTLGVLASAMPLFTLFFRVGSAVPLAMLAARLRPRVCLLAAGATVFMALGVAGVSTAWTVAGPGWEGRAAAHPTRRRLLHLPGLPLPRTRLRVP